MVMKILMVEEEVVVEGGEGVGAVVDMGIIRESTKGISREAMKGTINESIKHLVLAANSGLVGIQTGDRFRLWKKQKFRCFDLREKSAITIRDSGDRGYGRGHGRMGNHGPRDGGNQA
nr:hypothetical protein Iba_chr12aCG17690 [Ipomoea batatas]GMD64098.1 hypothetical protein Iba_chr12bCG21170 [Ipomoea batatas]